MMQMLYRQSRQAYNRASSWAYNAFNYPFLRILLLYQMYPSIKQLLLNLNCIIMLHQPIIAHVCLVLTNNRNSIEIVSLFEAHRCICRRDSLLDTAGARNADHLL